MNKEIVIYEKTGRFAENKELARKLRTKEILPALDNNETVILNFFNVDSATQSFIHALISDAIRKKGINILDRLYFKNCNKIVQEIISIVVEYMQYKQ